MTDIDSREGVQALINAIASESASGPSRPHLELVARLAATTGMRAGELTRAVAVELRLQELEGSLDPSGLTISHIRELRRIQPERAETIDRVARKAVVDSLPVRALRALVDDSLRGQAAQARTVRESSFRQGMDFERSAYDFVAMNKELFADERAMLTIQPRGSQVAVDFVLQDGTGILVAFEAKLARKPPPPRQVIDLVGAHALYGRIVGESFTVFSAEEPVFPASYRHCVEEFGLDRQHTLTLDLTNQDSGRCLYTIHRRTPDGWSGSNGTGELAQRD